MDRYKTLQDYWLAKQRIFEGAEIAVINRTILYQFRSHLKARRLYGSGWGSPGTHDFGVLERDSKKYLAQGVRPMLPVDALKIKGAHNISNALAALAVAESMNWPLDAVLELLQQYPGLVYRCQWVGEQGGVVWYNDSKATNVGATKAAIEGLHLEGRRLIWIAGGDAKDACFTDLASIVVRSVTYVFLFGRDRAVIAEALDAQGFKQWESHEHLESVFQEIKVIWG